MINKLFEMLSPSGAEDKIRNFITKQISDIFDSVTVDNIGNLIVHKEGNGKKICIECGMDNCGIMIVSVEPGKAFFSGVGQLSPSYLVDKRIIMNNSNWGIVRYNGENPSTAKLSELYLEIDTEDIKIGDFGIVYPDFIETDCDFFANGLSDILPAAAVISAVTSANIGVDLTVVFSSQKALGGRGLRSYFGVNSFDKVFTINCCECNNNATNGKGCALIVKDKSAVADVGLRKELESVAATNSVKIQPSVSSENFFIGNIAHSGKGNSCVCICIPVSYKGKTLEQANKNDFNETARLIQQIIK